MYPGRKCGAQFWRSFSSERPEGADPIEAWTKRVLEEIAAELGAKVLLASTGPPFLPLEWAKRSEPVTESPIGLLIHPVMDYGMSSGHAAVPRETLTEARSRAPGAQGMSPCDTCVDQPCMRACPVKVVNGDIFDVAACLALLVRRKGLIVLVAAARPPRVPRWKRLCLWPAQALHHMQGFLDTFGRVRVKNNWPATRTPKMFALLWTSPIFDTIDPIMTQLFIKMHGLK